MKMGAWIAGAAALALLAGCNKAEEKTASAPEAGKEAAVASTPETITAAKRKPGLWSHTTAVAGMNQTSKICIDEKTDAEFSAFGQKMAKDACSDQRMTRRLDGSIEFSSTCNLGAGGTVTSQGVATGDFNSRYQVKMTSTTTGAQMAQANGTRDMTLEAVWEGPCPADMKPGDIRIAGMPGMPNGVTINPSELARQGGMTPEKMAQMKAMAEQMKKQAER